MVDREHLRDCLGREVESWAGTPFTDIEKRLLAESTYERIDPAGAYQVEVVLLEATATYTHLSIAVDDGGLRAFLPLCRSFLIYRDGRVEK